MADTTKAKNGFNATVKSFGVTGDDVATLDSVYGTRAKPIYVSLDNAIATRPRPVIVMRGVLLNCGKPDRNGDIIGDVALNDYSRAIIGPGAIQWAPLEVDEERVSQAQKDLLEKFVSSGVIDPDYARSLVGFTPTIRKSTDISPVFAAMSGEERQKMERDLEAVIRGNQTQCVVVPRDEPKFHDWPHESPLSSGEASQSTVSPPTAPSPEPAPHLAYNIDSVVDFASLIPVAHAMAIDKGWWQDGIASRDMNEIIANYHAEVSEAWEEYRAGRMETWTNTDGKPEGFWVEIADLLIRVADSCGAGRHTFSGKEDPYCRGDSGRFPSRIVVLHQLLDRPQGLVVDYVVDECKETAARHNIDLFAVVRQKLAYNATRPHRHGGKKA